MVRQGALVPGNTENDIDLARFDPLRDRLDITVGGYATDYRVLPQEELAAMCGDEQVLIVEYEIVTRSVIERAHRTLT